MCFYFSQCVFYSGLSLRVLANLVSSLCANIECCSLLIHRLLAHTLTHTYIYTYVCVYSAYILCMIDQFACSAALWLDWCPSRSLSLHTSLSYPLSLSFSPSLSLLLSCLFLPCTALKCPAMLFLCLFAMFFVFVSLFLMHSLQDINRNSPCGSCPLSPVQAIQGENSLFPFGNSCQSHWINYDNNYSACCHDGLSIRF